MLYTITKYLNKPIITKVILLKSYKKLNKKYFYFSIFFRKYYFRTLLMYANLCYVNFDKCTENNFFYINNFLNSFISNKLGAFFLKKYATV